MASVVRPEPAFTQASAQTSSSNPIDDFFGCSAESRHDRRLSNIEPPPYIPPPEYTRKAEPATLAMYLFQFGFLFPPFWIMGAAILLSPLRAPSAEPASWMPEKTEAERAAVIAHLRKAETKWAWRCLIALLVFVAVGVAIGFTAWAVMRVSEH